MGSTSSTPLKPDLPPLDTTQKIVERLETMEEKQDVTMQTLQDTAKIIDSLKNKLQDEAKVLAIAQSEPHTTSCCAHPPALAPTPSTQSCLTGQTIKMVHVLPLTHYQSTETSSMSNMQTESPPLPVILVQSTPYSHDTVRVRYRGSGGNSRRRWYAQRNQPYRPGR
ncbi:uncharacterized protein LOC111694303 [Trichogramma pretiosum]|uniref:uncharacterized protein LOC111694303 n=1 Tax=Trichogramma pretiosum TaxID=7493 RepID=UPI000C71AD25|nr:uncharacterized protein LOC111694303 [Trichogramma pretiosum]